MADQHGRCAQTTRVGRDRFRVIFETGLRELFEIGAAFVVRKIRRVRFKPSRLEWFTKTIERPATTKRAVHKYDRCYDRSALHSANASVAPIRQTITSKPPRCVS